MCGVLVVASACAQGGPGGAMATRSVSKYLALERSLQQGLAARDTGAVGAMLDAGFELRTPTSPDSQSQDQWLKGALGKHGQVRDLSVAEMDDLALVSFVLEQHGAGRKNTSYFIVDAWRQSTGKLQLRYLDVPARPPAPRSRPDGRE
ncbi:MAG: nuclear transport factor 2 family protein [Pseudomonadota bacterium]